jgi:hypothetical protein
MSFALSLDSGNVLPSLLCLQPVPLLSFDSLFYLSSYSPPKRFDYITIITEVTTFSCQKTQDKLFYTKLHAMLQT